MLARVWQEMEYRFDVCRVTKGSYIEHCEKFNKMSISLMFEFKFLLRKLKIISFQKKVWFSYFLQLLRYKLS